MASPMRVVVAGGGIAGLEALVALHALAGDRVDLTVLAPVGEFAYRPLSTARPFTLGDERRLPLRELARELDAAVVPDALALVDEDRGRVLTQDGDFVPFDALIVAVGAHHSRAFPRGLTWGRGPEAEAGFAELLRELEGGTARSVAFVVPPGAAWPVDAYELALVAASAGGEIHLLTAEEAPLAAFGPAAGRVAAEELEAAGVHLRAGVEPRDVAGGPDESQDAFSAMVARLSRRPARAPRAGGAVLALGRGESLRVDRLVSLPTTRGPGLPGLPHDRRGYVAVDEHARAPGSGRVFVAGDATALRLRHSALAADQAQAAAQALAAEAGADCAAEPWSPTLYGILAVPPHFPGRAGSVWIDGGRPVTHCLWWPPGHVSGRHLSRWIARRDPAVHPGLLWHPKGLPVAAGVTPAGDSGSDSEDLDPEAIERDARTRQLLAIGRAERHGERLGQSLERRGEELERRHRLVAARLEAAGYIRHRADGRDRVR
jgi:sulfide:quinone oxidoreductase